jgi:hypothetical protein
MLIDNGNEGSASLNSRVINQKDRCNEVYLIFRIPSHRNVNVYKGRTKLLTVPRGTWLGTIEYLEYLGILDPLAATNNLNTSMSSTGRGKTNMSMMSMGGGKKVKVDVHENVRWQIGLKIEGEQNADEDLSSSGHDD